MREIKMVRVPGRVFLAFFAVCLVFIITRQIPPKIMIQLGIDKAAHMSVSFLLAVICLWIFQIRYHANNQKAKKAALLSVLAFGITWELSEFLDLKPVIIFAFPGIQSWGWNYIIDTTFDLMFDACGALWYLYAPEMFLFSSDSDPVP